MIDYVSDAVLALLTAKCRDLTCPDCGCHHPVEFSTDDTHSVVLPSFPEEGTCEGFIEKVNNLINTEAKRDNRDLLSSRFGLK